jgi:hypothetical protein
MFALFALVLTEVTAGCPREECANEAAPVRVTVVVVLASAENTTVDPKLKELAAEVQKRDKKLKGFKVLETSAKSIAVGDSAKFSLVEKQELSIKVEKPKDENGRVGMTIKPPELGEIKYTCACDKYFPIVTSYKTKSGETLIILVMSKPCAAKK